MKKFYCEFAVISFVCAIGGPSSGFAAKSDRPGFFLVRSPEILKGTSCERSGPDLGVILFPPEVKTSKYKDGGLFTVFSRSGEILRAKMESLEEFRGCHPLGDAKGSTLALLRFDHSILWDGIGDGDEALLALSDDPGKDVRIGKISKQEAPEGVRKEISRLFGTQERKRAKVTAQIFSFPNSGKKFALISSWVLPKNYDKVGDRGIIYFSTFWEIVGETWKRTAKVDGSFRVFSAIDLGGSAGLVLGINENETSSGTYKVIDFNGGKPGDNVQMLYTWMD